MSPFPKSSKLLHTYCSCLVKDKEGIICISERQVRIWQMPKMSWLLPIPQPKQMP